MLKFVIDEDMPRSTAKVLRTKSYEALGVRDWGFGNLLHFPIGSQCWKADV